MKCYRMLFQRSNVFVIKKLEGIFFRGDSVNISYGIKLIMKDTYAIFMKIREKGTMNS